MKTELHKVSLPNKSFRQEQNDGRTGFRVSVDSYECFISLPTNSPRVQECLTDDERHKLLFWMLGCLKAGLIRGNIIGPGLDLNDDSESLEVSNDEMGFLTNGNYILWSPYASIRMAILERAYHHLETGQYDVGRSHLDPADSERDERLDKTLLITSIRYLLTAEFLTLAKPNFYELTAKGIDRIEQLSSPSAMLGFGVLAFNEETNALWSQAIAPAFIELGMAPVRIDTTALTTPIIDGIHKLIEQSQLLIADLTFGRPNCYYEVGWAHALEKPVILSVRDDRFDDVHFDVRSYTVCRWDPEELNTLKTELVNRGRQLINYTSL